MPSTDKTGATNRPSTEAQPDQLCSSLTSDWGLRPVRSAYLSDFVPDSGTHPVAVPLPQLREATAPTEPPLRITTTVMNDRGRIATTTLIEEMGWPQRQPISITLHNQLIHIHTTPGDSNHRVDARRHILLPATIRTQARLHAGDRLLLVADPECEFLLVYPPAALSTLLRTASPNLWPSR
ncbi:hypothetical protein [Nocardia sp. SYP-A9097]|uniref:hypothetical protein n=1 Tax=Nocardia sp. SYP-A9097 TaxID=2663237 RepID=UPI00129A7DE1|nr:hypothetical protein [Nocardia sp. SYP-A9097]